MTFPSKTSKGTGLGFQSVHTLSPPSPTPAPPQAFLRLPIASGGSYNSVACHSRRFVTWSCRQSGLIWGPSTPPRLLTQLLRTSRAPWALSQPRSQHGLLNLLPGHPPGRGRIGVSLFCTPSSPEQRSAPHSSKPIVSTSRARRVPSTLHQMHLTLTTNPWFTLLVHMAIHSTILVTCLLWATCRSKFRGQS